MAAHVYDAIVLGLGAHGSAALYHLASRGLKVLGLERHALAHAHGSSHGLSRIIRTAYQEHPSYVPLLQEAWALWRQLEADSGQALLSMTGCLNIARRGAAGSCFEGALASARQYHLDHEVLQEEAVRGRFPAYRLPPGFQALYEAQAGVLHPEACIQAHVALARRHGAHVLEHARAASWEALPAAGSAAASTSRGRADGGPVAVHVEGGGRHEARSLVLAPGGWMGHLVPQLAPVLQVERQVVAWLRPPAGAAPDFGAGRFPVFLLQDGEGYLYGFPADEHGVKLGLYHHLRQHGSAEDLSREVVPEDEALLRRWAARYFPALAGGTVGCAAACLFTNTPDEHFIVDRHPAHSQVVLVSACSGHGFKFAPVIGEAAADLVTGASSTHDMSLHALDARRPGFAPVLMALAAA